MRHWGATPCQNFIYVHLNGVIKKYDLKMFYIAGPGHGGQVIVGKDYLEGTWSEISRPGSSPTISRTGSSCTPRRSKSESVDGKPYRRGGT